jgi:hypothetical protein
MIIAFQNEDGQASSMHHPNPSYTDLQYQQFSG